MVDIARLIDASTLSEEQKRQLISLTEQFVQAHTEFERNKSEIVHSKAALARRNYRAVLRMTDAPEAYPVQVVASEYCNRVAFVNFVLRAHALRLQLLQIEEESQRITNGRPRPTSAADKLLLAGLSIQYAPIFEYDDPLKELESAAVNRQCLYRAVEIAFEQKLEKKGLLYETDVQVVAIRAIGLSAKQTVLLDALEAARQATNIAAQSRDKLERMVNLADGFDSILEAQLLTGGRAPYAQADRFFTAQQAIRADASVYMQAQHFRADYQLFVEAQQKLESAILDASLEAHTRAYSHDPAGMIARCNCLAGWYQLSRMKLGDTGYFQKIDVDAILARINFDPNSFVLER